MSVKTTTSAPNKSGEIIRNGKLDYARDKTLTLNFDEIEDGLYIFNMRAAVTYDILSILSTFAFWKRSNSSFKVTEVSNLLQNTTQIRSAATVTKNSITITGLSGSLEYGGTITWELIKLN